jgi:hypothetical protein
MPKRARKKKLEERLPGWIFRLYVFKYGADHLLNLLQELVKLVR